MSQITLSNGAVERVNPNARRIVILGGGFGGVYTARHLEKLTAGGPDVQVTLVSRDNYLLMPPLLFEAGSGVLEPRHVVAPLRPMFKRVRFVEGEIVGVDFERRVVKVKPVPDETVELPYDHLVLALGGVTNRAIIPGSESAMAFKHLADAIYLRNHTIDLMERAEVEADAARRRKLLTFVVIGGGLVGVELMGELTEFVKNLLDSYPRLSWADVRFELIEAGPRIMKEVDEDLARYAAQVLAKRGVRVRTATPVRLIEEGQRVHLPDGEVIEGASVILAAGVGPNPLLRSMDVAKHPKGRVLADATMRSVQRPEVWALGDCAAVPGPDGKLYPQLAQHALRQAKVLAGNIVAALRGQTPRPFVYKTLGTLAALGHYKGVGRVWKFKVRGFLAWWVWRTYYLMQMPRWERRVRIVLDWTVALLFRNDVAKLELYGKQYHGRGAVAAPTTAALLTPEAREPSLAKAG